MTTWRGLPFHVWRAPTKEESCMTDMKTMLFTFLAAVLCTFAFASLCWPLIDALVPVAGVHFWDVWQAHSTLTTYFAGLDTCGLGTAFVYRADIVASVSLLMFGPYFGSQLHRVLILRHAGRHASFLGSLLKPLAFALLVAIAMTEFAVIWSPIGDAGACVVELRLQKPY